MAHPVDMSPQVHNAPTGAAAPGTSAPVDGQRKAAAGAYRTEGGARHDRVELSEQARLLESMSQTLKTTPDEREAVVAAVRAKLDAGTYSINAMQLAARLAPSLTPAPGTTDPGTPDAGSGAGASAESQA